MTKATFFSHLLRHIELYFTALGLLVIFTVPLFFAPDARAATIAVTAVLVGVIHGALFWLVRRRQRTIRAAVIEDLQMMLKDRINNKLQVVLVRAVTREHESSAENHARLQEVSEAVLDVSQLLDRLSIESLSAWQKHYAFKPSAP